ncbi:MAG: toprim domain-containing protein [Magnetococcales bacterium]|nr:toprim domain-containing protein [Magnetococcales bacterium]
MKALRNQQVAIQLFDMSGTDMLEVKEYLSSRAITIDPPETIRFLPSVHLDLPPDMAYLNRRKSMMVALVQNGAGDPIAIHHTSLVADKDDKHRKMMLGPIKGGSVRLGNHPVSGNKMAIGEGVESCLSFMQATGINTWSGMTEGGLRGFELPKEKPSTVYILADVDEEKIIRGVAHRVGQEAARKAAQRIADMGIETHIVWPGDPMGPKIDFNDLLRDDPSGESIRAALAKAEAVLPHTPPAQPPGDEWLSLLRIGAGSSGALPNLNNAATVLENHQSFNNMFAFDEFRYTYVLTNRPPWVSGTGAFATRDLSDNDALCLTRWLQGTALGTYSMPRMGVITSQQAMETIGAQTRIHPVRDWMDSLVWDTNPRLSTWLTDYFGVADSSYVQAVARAWLISAIARIYRPGCKADGVLVLVGEQGAKKSQGLKVIGGDWFRDSIFDLSNKDAFIQIRGVWIYELSELSALARADVEKVKAFMSSQVDSYRPPFGRANVDVPRQLVFAATTNAPEFLKDQTGNRRFWPVDVADDIDIAGLTTSRDQLIAEAVAAYKAGEKWWLSKKEEAGAKEEQDSHLAADPWEAKVRSCVKMMDGVTGFTVNDILMQIETDVAKWQVGWDGRIGIILKKLGYYKKRVQNQEVRERRFFHSQKNGQGGQGSQESGQGSEDEKDVANQSQWPGCPGCPGFSVCTHRREGGSYTHTHAGCAHVAHQTTAHRGKCMATLANPGHSIENKQLSHTGTLATTLATFDHTSNVVPIWPGVMEDDHDTFEGFGDRI